MKPLDRESNYITLQRIRSSLCCTERLAGLAGSSFSTAYLIYMNMPMNRRVGRTTLLEYMNISSQFSYILAETRYFLLQTYQAIQILFFFTLVMSVEKILSHLIAFAFHKTAYSERIESLQHDLNVLDHLRNYRPKRQSHKPSPSAHRSVFAGFPSLMAVTPSHERTGFSWGLGGDGRRSRPDTPEGTDDEGHAGDTEGVNSSTKKRNFRKSWGFNTTKQETLGTNDRPSPTDQPYPDLHSYPPKPREALRSGQSSPNHKHLDDGDDAVVVQAARALKHAVLHDARNIKGKPVNTGLGWDVASAHEAKVGMVFRGRSTH